uniref:Uncharacterized protein n=1 Tax=Oryza brachyantha TaxID=4533 RepID=J3LHU9_ORYBR
MTFSSAIFLPSKVTNPFSSFHWCLKLPDLFFFFTTKGLCLLFCYTPSPSILWAWVGIMHDALCQALLSQVPSHLTLLPMERES